MKIIALFFLVLSLSYATIQDDFASQAGMSIDEALDLVNGILDGMNVKGGVDNIKACMQEVPQVIAKVKEFIEAIGKLDWKDLDKVFEFFSKMFDTLRHLFDTLKPCFKTPKDIEGIIKKIGALDPAKLLQKIMAKIWIIFTTITDCLKKFEKKQYHDAGKAIGDIVYMILLEDQAASLESGFMDFVKGLLEGIGVKDDIQELLKCVKGEGQEVLKKIKEALELLKHISIRHLNNLKKGLKALLGAIMEIFQMIIVCGPKCEILIKLMNAIKNCNIASIVYHIIKHAPSFVKDIVQAIACFSSGQLNCAGQAVGHLLRIIFLGGELDENDNGYVFDFFKGFFEGLGEEGSLKDLEPCLKNFEHLYADIIKAIQLIKTLEIEKIIEGLKILVEVVKHIIDVITPCKKGMKAFDKLISAIKNADIMKIVVKIMKEPAVYIKFLTDIIEAFSGKDFYGAGKGFGAVLKKLLME